MCFLENSSLFGKLSEIDGAAKILRVLCYYVINHELSRVREENVVSHNLDGTCNFHIKILSDPPLPYLHSSRHTWALGRWTFSMWTISSGFYINCLTFVLNILHFENISHLSSEPWSVLIKDSPKWSKWWFVILIRECLTPFPLLECDLWRL